MSWVITGSEKTPVDPQFGSVSLLLHGDGTNGSTTFTDSSPRPKVISRFGDAQISTAQSKFGGSSIYLDGTGDYIRAADSSDFSFGIGDFTVELWAYWTGSGNQYFIDTRTGGGTGLAWQTEFYQASGYSASWPTNEWFHAAITRQASSVRIFKNGSLVATFTDANILAGASMYIGARFSAQSLWSGYIDDLRITKGIARYTANFTPPTAPFPDI
jgi:hypothetical protein